MDNTSIRSLKACGFSEDLITAIVSQSGFESILDIGEQTEEDLRRLVKRIAADNALPIFPLVSENSFLGSDTSSRTMKDSKSTRRRRKLP